jgi:excisionase family DNA binding protein
LRALRSELAPVARETKFAEGEMNTKRPEYLTTDEVVELTRLRKSTIYKLAARGQIPCRRLRRRLLFPAAEIERWILTEGEAMPNPIHS